MKGNIKGNKPPAIVTDISQAAGDMNALNARSPLNLIRKWEKKENRGAASVKGAAKSLSGMARERGSSEEDDSTDAATNSQPATPATPAGGYEGVLDSVLHEILAAEAVMARVTTTFGVDRCLPLTALQAARSFSFPPCAPPWAV